MYWHYNLVRELGLICNQKIPKWLTFSFVLFFLFFSFWLHYGLSHIRSLKLCNSQNHIIPSDLTSVGLPSLSRHTVADGKQEVNCTVATQDWRRQTTHTEAPWIIPENRLLLNFMYCRSGIQHFLLLARIIFQESSHLVLHLYLSVIS